MNKRKYFGRIFFTFSLVIFILLFTYSSLNLKNIDYGYELQKMILEKGRLEEEIDYLEAQKAKLTELGRIEKKVKKQLGYVYPSKDQIIRIKVGRIK